MSFSLKRKIARQTWQEALPFGLIITIWGILNIVLYVQIEPVTVIDKTVEAIWMINIAVFLLGGLSTVVYLSYKIHNNVAWFEGILNSVPCAVFVSGENKQVQYANIHARKLSADGSFSSITDLSRWTLEKVNLCGIEFPGIYTNEGEKYALRETMLKDRKERHLGNVTVLLEVTNLVDSRRNIRSLSTMLEEMNLVLCETTDYFNSSLKSLAESTLNQALAFQELAEYLYSISHDVQIDTLTLQEKMKALVGHYDQHNVEHSKNLEVLNHSVQMMAKSHRAAENAATRLKEMNI